MIGDERQNPHRRHVGIARKHLHDRARIHGWTQDHITTYEVTPQIATVPLCEPTLTLSLALVCGMVQVGWCGLRMESLVIDH
jgi:hypothetical protein